MALQRLVGTDLDQIGTSIWKVPSYRVLLFDPYEDTFSNVVLDRYSQVPLDITPYVMDVQITTSHSGESNQATVSIAGAELDYRLFMFSWLKVYAGDARVDAQEWPCVFVGIFKGQPGRANERGALRMFQHTAYDRSVFFQEKRITSNRVWNPEDTDANLGEICVEIATNSDWGMGLDRQEVLFGKFFRNNVTATGTGLSVVTGGSELRVNKKLQVVDVTPMEALTNIMQVAGYAPAFNGEGKLVARDLSLDKPPVRVYDDEHLIHSVNIPQNTMTLPTSVQVTGLDYRCTRLDYKLQKLMTIGPVTVGMFAPTITTKQSYSENNEFRAVPQANAQGIKVTGSLLATIFAFDSRYEITVAAVDDFNCEVTIYFAGAAVAIVVVTATLLVYFGLRWVGDALGSTPGWEWLGFALDAASSVLLLLILETMRSIGTIECEVWGIPFEYVYREIEAKAILSDTTVQEDSPSEIRNLILGTLEDCEDLARSELRRQVAMTCSRSIRLADDLLLEPNDIVELNEEGETARYYILEIGRTLSRSAEPVIEVSCFRCR